MRCDSIAASRGVKSGLGHTAGGRRPSSRSFFVLAGAIGVNPRRVALSVGEYLVARDEAERILKEERRQMLEPTQRRTEQIKDRQRAQTRHLESEFDGFLHRKHGPSRRKAASWSPRST